MTILRRKPSHAFSNVGSNTSKDRLLKPDLERDMANKQKKPVTQEEQTQRHIRSAEELRKGAPIINAMVAAVAWTSSASKEVEGLIHGDLKLFLR
jgi:hypothetical protein